MEALGGGIRHCGHFRKLGSTLICSLFLLLQVKGFHPPQQLLHLIFNLDNMVHLVLEFLDPLKLVGDGSIDLGECLVLLVKKLEFHFNIFVISLCLNLWLITRCQI